MDSVPSMASSSSSTVPSSEQTSHFMSQTETEMESSKTRDWSQLDYSTTDSEWSAEANSKYFPLLKEDPQWGRFFTDFEALEVGEKISEGAQADIYEARNRSVGPFDLVVKVMKGDAPLRTFQAQWPIGMLSARSKHKHLFDLPLITILGGTVLRDERLRGRFAFVMYRRWGDLRTLIDRLMKEERDTPGPFSIDEAIHLMLSLAKDMDILHNKHDIIHRDLKASNVLVWGGFKEDMSLFATPNRKERMGSVVADFECCVGVLGTRLWRAPEILKQLKARVPSAKICFTLASDVYSYGMTCYEIVTGCIPFDGLGDTRSEVLQGQCQELPHELPEFVRTMIVGCWHSEPLERPSFSTICTALKLKIGPNPMSVVIDNTSEGGASIVKVEKWNNPQALTLFEVMQILMHLELLVLKACDLSSPAVISQYFEVTDCKGRKVVKDKSIANITQALSLAIKTEWINKSLGTPIDKDALVQIHVVEVVAEWSASLIGVLFRFLVAMNFQVHSAGCWTCDGRVKCVMYVEGTRMGSLLWELRHNMEYFPISHGRFKIIVRKAPTKEVSHLNRCLYDLSYMDLSRPRWSSNIHVHERHQTRVVVCLENHRPLKYVAHSLGKLDYEIVEASDKYPGPLELVKGRHDFQVKTGGQDEKNARKREMIDRILRSAIEREYFEGNLQISIAGRSEELVHDVMRSVSGRDLVVTGGQVVRDDGGGFDPELSIIPWGYLELFVAEKPAAGAD